MENTVAPEKLETFLGSESLYLYHSLVAYSSLFHHLKKKFR